MTGRPSLSVVVPLLDEEPNVAPLVDAVRRALGRRDWELLLVDDGSTDGTFAAASAAAGEDPRVRVIRLARNYGQATALQVGFERSTGEVVVSMDGDLQNDPRDIPRLVRRVREGHDIVAGYRKDRKDAFLTRTLPSRVANGLIRWVTGTPLRDNGCSLKAYRREVLERMHLYSDMHRFAAPLAAGTAGARVDELPVRHHPRRHGTSKYGLSRTWTVLADLVTVKALRSFRERPLMLFSLLAFGLGAVGVVLGAATVSAHVGDARSLLQGSFVFPTASLLCFEVSAFLLMLGLIAEVVLRGRWQRRIDRPVASEWGETA